MDSSRLLLLVEDDATFARTLTRSFERRGYRVLQAASAEEVRELLQTHSPQYAVMDLKLPANASGLSCVQMLHPHNPQAPLLFLPAYPPLPPPPQPRTLNPPPLLAPPP